MSLNKVTYVDGVTVIGAQNLNDIQDAIIAAEQSEADLASAVEQNADDIAANTQAIANVEQEVYKAFPVDNASGAVAFFPDGADGLPVAELTVSMVPVQAGSGDPSPDNVRPISGRTGLTLTRVGANLLPPSIVGTQNGVTATIADDGAIYLSGTATALTIINGDFGAWQWDGVTPVWLSGCPSGGDYTNTYSLRVSATSATPRAVSRPDAGNGVALASSYADSSLVNVPLRFQIVIRAGVNADGLVFRPMLNVGTSASAFAPYSGENVTVSWENEAGTVYAGTLEVTSGVLTARPYYAAYAGEALVGPWVSSLDVYAPGAVPTTGAQVVDLGGAETVYRLTAQEVSTLPGTNSIWSDAGDTAVTYRADLTKYIDKRLQVVQAQIDTDA